MLVDLAWPFHVGSDGRERTVDRGSVAEGQQVVDMTMHVPAGHLAHDREFGRPEYQFASDVDAAIRQTIADDCDPVTDYDLTVNGGSSFAVSVTGVAELEPDVEVTL